MMKQKKNRPTRRPGKNAGTARATIPVAAAKVSFPVIAMAASVGGLKALSVILGALPADFPAAIAIVMHLAPDHKSLLAEILKSRTHLAVKQAHTGDVLSPSSVFIAPPNHHLSVAKGGRLKLSSSHAEKVHYARPSAEPLFVSVAAIYKKNAIAVVLTGGDGDGSFGVQIIKDKGGQVIAQDRATSENFSMPETSIETGDVDFILPLDKIAPKLMELVERGPARGTASPFAGPKRSPLGKTMGDRGVKRPEGLIITHNSEGRSSILKGLDHSAQGCEARATLGHGDKDSPTLKGLKHRSLAARPRKNPALAATPSGLKKNTFALTQGSSPTRNPGLNDGIPSGFKEAAKDVGKVKRAPASRTQSHRATPRYAAGTKAVMLPRRK
jgi:two-component system chemotaxis response regulator CheB